MKKILILTAGYGEGHNTAARNIGAGIEAVAGGRVEARVLDPLSTTYGWVDRWATKCYVATINHLPSLWAAVYRFIDSCSAEYAVPMNRLRAAMKALLEAEQPDAVVSTHPIYNFALKGIARDGRKRRFAQVTAITDSISVNSVWHRFGSDAYIVANEDTAAVLRKRRVPAEKIHVIGFPVSLRFADREPVRIPPPPGGRWRVLHVINSGKRDAPSLVRRLLQFDEIDLKITVGRDELLRKAIEEVVAQSDRKAEVFGWTDRMPDLICDSHLLISKAGGATVQEALAARTPMVMTQVVPGQEEGNARLLLQHRCGIMADSSDRIVAAVRAAFANDGALWGEWCANIDGLRRPNAAREIAQFILSL